MGQYLIRTPAGDKGPFTLEQLEKLVAAQKVPVTMDVIESESGLAVSLADLILGTDLAPEPVAPPPAAHAPPPAEHVAPATAAPRRGAAPRRAPARGGSGHPAGSHGRYVPAKKSPLPMIIGSILVVALMGVGGWLYVKNQSSFELQGKWYLDVDDFIAKGLERGLTIDGATPEEVRANEALLRAKFGHLAFEFRGDRVSLTEDGQVMESAKYEVLSEDSEKIVIRTTDDKTGEVETDEIRIEGEKIRVTDEGRSMLFFRAR